jgi:hypothetical protein
VSPHVPYHSTGTRALHRGRILQMRVTRAKPAFYAGILLNLCHEKQKNGPPPGSILSDGMHSQISSNVLTHKDFA